MWYIPSTMNRADLQKLAELRIQEAKLLLDNRFHEGAYYLAGYAIECALKACIAKKTKAHDFPDLKLAKDSYEHNLSSLLKTAGLEALLMAELRINRKLANNWKTVSGWSVEARYEPFGPGDILDLTNHAADLYSAIMDSEDGLLPWLKKHW